MQNTITDCAFGYTGCTKKRNYLRVDVRENQTNVKNRGKVQKFKSFQIFMLHRHQCDKKRAVVFLGKYYLLFEKKNILKCLS